MNETRANYKLKRFISSSTPGFAEALRIYARAFPTSLRTDTNEISYWLDHYTECFSDQFLAFGFYVNNQLVGYAQLAYFVDERLLVIDYLAVEKAHRRPNIFLEFVEHLRIAIEQLSLDADYVVGEVGLQLRESGDTIDPHTRGLLRLLRSVGFGVAKAPYIQPQLGFTNRESRTPAALVIDTGEGTPKRKIQRDTYLDIVHTLYYKHYVRWFSIYKGRGDEYTAHVTELIERLKEEIPEGAIIPINGYPKLEGHSSAVQVWDGELKRFARVAGTIATVLALVSAITATVLLIQQFTRASFQSVTVVFTLVIFAFFSMLTIFYPSTERVLDRIIALIPFLAQPDRIARHSRQSRNLARWSIQNPPKRGQALRTRKPKQ